MTTNYQQKADSFSATVRNLAPELDKLSFARLAIFLFTGILTLIFAANGLALGAFVTAVAGAGLFAATLREYNRLTAEKDRAECLKKINEDEVRRLAGDLSAFPTGEAFLSRNHPYAADLDVFGNHSLFQLLNRATTSAGVQMLADWLNAPADRSTIAERQQAVRELSPQLDWRQGFQATGMQFQSPVSDYSKLLEWMHEQPILLDSKRKLMLIRMILAFLSSTALCYFLVHLFMHLRDLSVLHLLPLVVTLAINSLYLRKFRAAAEHIILCTQRNVDILRGYQSLIEAIQHQHFECDKLRKLHCTLGEKELSAANEIHSLVRTLEIFQQKGTRNTVGKNAFYGIINNLWLTDIHLILQTETWKVRNRDHVLLWINAVSELEALAGIAGYAYSNPGYAFPEILSTSCAIDFKDVGHPLLNSSRRVNNNFTMEGQGSITMITGSNMAGKSTFLRTIGANLVLAFAGAPCSATSARMPLLRVFTSMRTQDNLEESISSFYAELKRIEQLLRMIEDGEPVFFLLDEMFKGTNSQDRFRGGKSLIKQLSEMNAFGVISTHDLDLAQCGGAAIRNFSFNSTIHDGQISFDYLLTPGICTDFNASELMKRSGIRILS